MGTITKENPWKGLNFYREKDKNDFYGREEDIERLSLYIINNAQTILFGKSGIGKSSILNAGVFPVAREHGLFPVPIKLIHNSDISYLLQIKDRIDNMIERQGASIHELVPAIDEQSETLWEYLHRTIIYDSDGKRVRLLLVIDQFEEIFTLQQDDKIKEQFFAELADLLNDVTPLYIANALNNRSSSSKEYEGNTDQKYTGVTESEIKIDLNLVDKSESKYLERSEFHIVLTLRDDFLGCLERYTTNIPCMKTNRYALQPLTKKQAEEIITMPRENLVADGVADLIIQKVTDKADNRLNGLSESSVDAAMLSLYLSRLYTKRDSDEEQITVELVQQFSDNIIKDFYEDAVKGIPIEIIEKIEDELLTFDDRRNNISINDFNKMGIPENIIRSLVDDKKLLRQFNYGGDIRVEYMHDVLCKVVSERIEQRELRKAKEYEKELKKKNKRMWFGVAAIGAFLTLAILAVWDGLYHNVEVHYGIVVKHNGWFEGLERISENEASYRDCSYKLKYHGRWAKFPYAMEARNGYGKLTTNHNMGAYILNQYDDSDKGADEEMVEKLKTVCQWEFISNPGGNFVVQERALDKDGNVVFVYNRSSTDDPSMVISTYTDEYGFPLMLRDSTYFYMRTTYDKRGYEVLMEFYDDQGMPITNKDSVYQTRREYINNGIELAQYSCFLDGRYTKDRFGNCGYYHSKFTEDSLRVLEAIYVDQDMNYCRSTDDSVIVTKCKYDEHGRLIELSYWNEEGKPDTCNYGYHIQQLEYNRYGKQTRKIYFGLDSTRCTNNIKIDGELQMVYEWIANYDGWGNMIEMKSVCKSIIYGASWQYLEDETCTKQEIYRISNEGVISSNDTIYSYRFYRDLEGRTELEMNADEGYSKYTSYDDHKNPICVEYFDSDNNLPIDTIEGWHINKMVYEYKGDTTYISDYCYNLEYSIVYHREILVDSLNYTKSELVYSNDGNFLEGYRRTYDNKYEIAKTQESINEEWNTIRSYKNPQFYYRAKIMYSIKPSKSKHNIGIFAENELGEPSVIFANPIAYYARYDYHGKILYFDETGRQIDPYYPKWNYLAYIELAQSDSLIGFKDADIVLACNDWDMWFSKENPMVPFYNTHWWDNTERDFIVARLNKTKNDYDTIHVLVAANTNIKSYVEFKTLRCTAFEERRISSIFNKYIRKRMIMARPVDTKSIACRLGIQGYIALLEYNDWKYLKNDTIKIQDLINLNKKKHKYIVYFDDETNKISVLDIDADMLGLQMEDLPIRYEYYNYVMRLYNEWKKTHK